MLGGNAERQDKMRLCPSCRTAISVSAMKCRYCGEQVGRPKEEARELSINDLGGESHATHVSSGNVMDALEQFRSEEMTAIELERQKKLEKKSLFKRKNDEGMETSSSDLPELDEYHKNLAQSLLGESASGSSPGGKRSYQRPSSGPIPLRMVTYAAVAVVGVFILIQGFSSVRGLLLDRGIATETGERNTALRLMSQGKHILALEEAVRFASTSDAPQHRETLEEVRAGIAQEVEQILSKEPFTREQLSEALSLVEVAAKADSGERISTLYESTKAEFDAYNSMLQSINGNSATFKVTLNGQSRDVTVQEDDVLAGRFKVERITTNFVKLRETIRKKSGLGRSFNVRQGQLIQ